MSHHLPSHGYSKMFYKSLTKPNGTRSSTITNDSPHSIPHTTGPLPATNKPLPVLPSSRLRRVGRAIVHALDPRRLRHSRRSVPGDLPGSFDDSGYDTHSNIHTTESPGALAHSMLAPPPGLGDLSLEQRRIHRGAFARSHPPAVRWIGNGPVRVFTPYHPGSQSSPAPILDENPDTSMVSPSSPQSLPMSDTDGSIGRRWRFTTSCNPSRLPTQL